MKTGQADPLAHQVADRHVGDRQVDRLDRHAALAGRSSPGCRGRPPRRRGAPASPPRARFRGPRPAAPRSARSRTPCPRSGCCCSESTTPTSILVPPRSTPIVSRGVNGRKGPAAACVSIDIPCLRQEMIGRPSGPGDPRAEASPTSPRSPAGRGGQARPKAAEKPEYTVYGRSGRGGQKRSAQPRKKPAAEKAGKQPREKPPYRVYRSRPSLRDRIRKPEPRQHPQRR